MTSHNNNNNNRNRNINAANNGNASVSVRRVYGNATNGENDGYEHGNRVSNTKYTPATFLFANLRNQFSQPMNRYFLVIATLQLWDKISPVNPFTTWIPLIFIFAINMVKEAVDDRRRSRADQRANERTVRIVRNNTIIQVQAQTINVGDIVYCEEGEEFACDMVALKSSGQDGLCYIQTANVDGETNYKRRLPIQQTSILSIDAIQTFTGIVECAPPNGHIYQFDSTITLSSAAGSTVHALSTENLLLQATHLRNTKWVYGICVYAGNQTKVGRNKSAPQQKWTRLDRYINRVTIIVFALQFSLIASLGTVGTLWRHKHEHSLWYVAPGVDKDAWYNPILIPLRFLLLASMMIPISLKVSLDLAKLIYSLFINWDIDMYDSARNIAAFAANTAISEDLGQIEYVMTDKTGTLTENEMIFRKCCIGDTEYGERTNALDDIELRNRISTNDIETMRFIRSLALCNTVVPSHSGNGNGNTHDAKLGADNNISLVCDSPDEEALVLAASKLGVQLYHRDHTSVQLSVNNVIEEYKLLHIFEFTSVRKRMTVVLQSSQGVFMVSKGADEVMLSSSRLRDGQYERVNHFRRILDSYSTQGLRTLVLAFKKISDEEYNDWRLRFDAANVAMHHRHQLLEEAYNMMETGLFILGVSGVEDRLQDKVALTIQTLRKASIKVWMLTGDKQQTAVEISRSCNLMATSDTLVNLSATNHDDVHDAIQRGISSQLGLDRTAITKYVVVIDGQSLALALAHYEQSFVLLASQAVSVVCCRVTPAQKAMIVRLIKDRGHITLAIGDGGNDVAMIQEANIGVGISGREGLQAARAADYSLSRFNFLARLCLVHGRYSYNRTAFIAQYCFYKAAVIGLCQLLFSFSNGFSGSSFFDSFSLMTYNMFYTSLPVMTYVLVQDVSPSLLLRDPSLYIICQKGSLLTARTLCTWLCRGVYHALVLSLFTIHSTLGSTANTWGPNDHYTNALVGYSAAVFLQCIIVMFEFTFITKWNHIAVWGTLALFFLFNISISMIPSWVSLYRLFLPLVADPTYWLRILFMVVTCMVPVVALKYYSHQYSPTPQTLGRIIDINAKQPSTPFYSDIALFGEEAMQSPLLDAFVSSNDGDFELRGNDTRYVDRTNSKYNAITASATGTGTGTGATSNTISGGISSSSMNNNVINQ